MTPKNIRITEDVYKKLMKIKKENENFSELFLRLLKIQKDKMEKSFGAWKISEMEKNEIWEDIIDRTGRKWEKSIYLDRDAIQKNAKESFMFKKGEERKL